MMNDFSEKSEIGRKIGKLFKDNMNYFVWQGVPDDIIEESHIKKPKYKGKGKYYFWRCLHIITNMSDNGFTSKHGDVMGVVYLEEGKELILSDIDKHLHINLK